MKRASHLVTPPIKGILSVLCRVDSRELKKIPARGPCIIVVNHVNFLEVPLIYAFLYPRDSVGMAKKETWNNPLLAFLAFCWDAIPLHRHATDREAMERALMALAKGRFLVIAPEGRRSGHGRLQEGRPGVVLLALKSGAPIIPMAHTGGEHFWTNLKEFKRTPFAIRVGQPFYLRIPPGPDGKEQALTRSLRREMADGVMNRISLLLPAEQRGAYPEPEKACYRTIDLLQEPGL